MRTDAGVARSTDSCRRAVRVIASSAVAVMLFSAPYRMFAQQPSPRIVWVDSAGRISGIVRSSETDAPVPFARVTIQPHARDVLARGDGTFQISDVPAGQMTLVVRQIGFAPARVDLMPEREPASPANRDPLVVRLSMLPYELDTVRVVARGACTRRGFVDPDASPAVRSLLEQVSLNAEQYLSLLEAYPTELTYATRRWLLTSDGEPFNVREDTVRQKPDALPEYAPGRVLEARETGQGRLSYSLNLPGFGTVGMAAFQEHHCFRFAGREEIGEEHLYRIDFQPTSDVKTTDVEGSLYLDRRTLLLRHARFRVIKLPSKGLTFRDVEARVTFRELSPFFVAPFEVEATQKLVNVRADDGRRLTEGRQSDRLISHRFLGATPDATAAPAHGARSLP